MGTFVWEPWRGHFVWGVRSGNFVLELPLVAFGVETSFGNFRSETVVWDPSFVNLRSDFRLTVFTWEIASGTPGYPEGYPQQWVLWMGIIIKWGGERSLRHALTNSPRPPGQVKAVQKIATPHPQISTDCAHSPVFQRQPSTSTSPTTDRTTRKRNHFGNGFWDVGQPVGAGLVLVGVGWGCGWLWVTVMVMGMKRGWGW